MLKQFRAACDRRLTLANLLDVLLPWRAEEPVSYHDDLRGLDGQPQPVQRFAQLHAEVAAMARFLVEELGMRRLERVVIYKRNDPRCFRWFMAVIRAGGIAVPLNPALSRLEVERVVASCQASILITDAEVFRNRIGAMDLPPVRCWVADDYDRPPPEGFRRLTPAWLDGPLRPPVDLAPGDAAAIFPTSGTTGSPKLIALSSRTLLAMRGLAAATSMLLGPRDRALFALPWAHILAVSAALAGLIAGVPARFLTRFDVARALHAFERDPITVFIGVPAMLVELLNASPAPEKLAAVRLWISAGDHLPRAVRKRLLRHGALFRVLGRRVIGPLILNAYGLVELGGMALCGLDSTLLPGAGELCLPVLPYRVRIADEAGRPLPAGHVGHCLIKGPGLPGGYWNRPPDGTPLLTRDGWLRTGDLAVRNRCGLIRLVGRSKDVIKCGGYSVCALDVEEVLASHTAVSVAVVVGVPHPRKGEAPVGVVESATSIAPTEEELIRWCLERMAAYKAPRRIHIVPPGSLPRGTTQKVLKRLLRQQYRDDFRLADEAPQ